MAELVPAPPDGGHVPKLPDGPRTRPPAPRRGGDVTAAAALSPPHSAFGSPGRSLRGLMSSCSSAAGVQAGEESFVEIDPTELQYGESVGSGATAEVFRGTWKDMPVAIKEIFINRKKDTKLELKMEVAFMREIAVMSKVNHENLVKFIGVCLQTRPLRVVSEFCEGDTLFGLLHDEVDIRLVWPQKIKMIADVGGGMKYLHTFNPQIIHRDLKSLNLLLAKEVTNSTDVPLVKVSDFGLARMKDAEGSEWDKMTKEAGTCHWMAPEVPSGKYDEKADVFSFAMVLYEIITREIPFEDQDGREAVGLVMNGVRPDLEAIPADAPKELVKLMQGCWEHDPFDRPSFVEIWSTVCGVKL